MLSGEVKENNKQIPLNAKFCESIIKLNHDFNDSKVDQVSILSDQTVEKITDYKSQKYHRESLIQDTSSTNKLSAFTECNIATHEFSLDHEQIKKKLTKLPKINLSDLNYLYRAKNLKIACDALNRIKQLRNKQYDELLRLEILRNKQCQRSDKHIRSYYYNHNYSCFMCHVEFSTITQLHAHLMTQEHLCMELSKDYIKYVEFRHVPRVSIAMQTNNNNLSMDINNNVDVNNNNLFNTSINDLHKRSDLNSFKHNSNKLKIGINENKNFKGNSNEKNSVLQKIILPFTRCMYCGLLIDFQQSNKHLCSESMSTHLDTEIDYMNANGSPFVCILCQGRVYNSPAELELHLAAMHGSQKDISQCALCQIEFKQPSKPNANSRKLAAVVYQNHLTEYHLPPLLLVEKLHFMGSLLIPRSIGLSAPRDNTPYRAYRCVFFHHLPAGKGPPFPFPHWMQTREHMFKHTTENSRKWLASRSSLREVESNNMDTGTHFTLGISSAKMPNRARGYRSCVISPIEIFRHLNKRFPKFNPFGINSNYEWCPAGHLGELSTLIDLTVHIICVHAGNPYSLEGAKELILAQHALQKSAHQKYQPSELRRITNLWLTKIKEQKIYEQKRDFVQYKSPIEDSPFQKSSHSQRKEPSVVLSSASDRRIGIMVHADETQSQESSLKSMHFPTLQREKLPKSIHQKLSIRSYSKKNVFAKDFDQERESQSEIRSLQSHESECLGELITNTDSEFVENIRKFMKSSRSKDSNQQDKRSEGKGSIKTDSLKSIPQFPRIEYQKSRKQSHLQDFLYRNKHDIAEEIRRKIETAVKNQFMHCRACNYGPLPDNRAFQNHMHESHIRPLEAQLNDLKRSGAFTGLIDPMRTCFQCYTILDDHFAFQIHMAVMHGCRYPLVCGLCRHPLISQAIGDEANQICLEIFESFGITDSARKLSVLAGSRWEPHKLTDSVMMKPKDAKAQDDLLQSMLEMNELGNVRASIEANLAVMRYSPQVVLRAIQLHERRHVERLRKIYLPDANWPRKCTDEKLLELADICDFLGAGQTMSDQYRETHLCKSEEHEWLISSEPVRFGPEAFEPCRELYQPLEPIKLENKKNTCDEKNAILPEEIREAFTNIHRQSITIG